MNELKKYQKLINGWVKSERKITCGEEISKQYKRIMMKRWQCLFDLCTCLKSDRFSDVLDVGRSYFSEMLSGYYKNVTTFGFDLADDGGHRELNECNLNHIVFDLQNADNPARWPNNRKYDLIIFSEVIEHLNNAPEYSLLLFKYLLKSDGIIICTTPNAAAIHKRIKMISGSNPYEKIRFFNNNPGHFREYTRNELYEMANKCGLEFIIHRYENFFTHTGPGFYARLSERLFSLVTAFVPSWKNQQIVVFRKDYKQNFMKYRNLEKIRELVSI